MWGPQWSGTSLHLQIAARAFPPAGLDGLTRLRLGGGGLSPARHGSAAVTSVSWGDESIGYGTGGPLMSATLCPMIRLGLCVVRCVMCGVRCV